MNFVGTRSTDGAFDFFKKYNKIILCSRSQNRIGALCNKMPIYRDKDENFFKIWSYDMAYVLGFIVADGCITKNKRGSYFLEIQSTDKNIVYKIRKVLKSNLKISEYQSKNKNYSKRYRMQIGSKIIFEDLIKLGITPRKSKTIGLPKMSNNYFSHFIRGYFDGDGCVNVCVYNKKDRKKPSKIINCGFTSGSKEILAEIKDKLLEMKIVKGGTLYYHNAYRLNFSIKDSLKLYYFMYDDLHSGLFLKRKKIIFESFFGGVA